MIAAFDAAVRRGTSPERVARTIERIVARDAPRLRYTVGREATALALLRRLLPQAGFEAALRAALARS
jgi:hypothetical protein